MDGFCLAVTLLVEDSPPRLPCSIMSTESLMDIQKILIKDKIFAKITLYENGCITTKILLCDLTVSQLKNSPMDSPSGKLKKSEWDTP